MSLREDARRIAALAWPVFVGQVSIVAFATVDTVLVGRHSPSELAALAVGASAYITVFIGLMGVVMAVGPIAGQQFGARQYAAAGHQLHQAAWVAAGLSLVGALALLFPWPFLALASLEPAVEASARAYMSVLALALPPSLLFAAYRGFNVAVSRPKAVMAMQLVGLSIKLPLSWLLVAGAPGLGLPALGAVGGGVASALAYWTALLLALQVLRRDAFYDRFELRGRGWHRPDGGAIRAQLRLGVPMGLGVFIEVSGFAMMAVFVARLGTTVVAGHQIVANLVSLMFMVPMALASACSTLVAQSIGARDLASARRYGWQGVRLGCGLALLLGGLVWWLREPVVGLYTQDAAVAAVAVSLLAWLVLFHLADALQIQAAFALRGWKVATRPTLIYAVTLWGVGQGGGYLLAFDPLGVAPAGLQGASGYWAASTAGMTLAALALTWLLARTAAAGRELRPAPTSAG
jgi:MATE family multidrug resistance protein